MKSDPTRIDPFEELALRLNAAFQRPADGDWLDVRRRLRRLHRTRNRVLMLAGVLLVGVVACTKSAGIVPWLNHHPNPVKSPPAASPCRVADLSVLFEYSSRFSITNEGRNACSLAGRPRLKLIDPEVRKSRILEKYFMPPKPAPGSLGTLMPTSLLRAVPPGQSVDLSFSWSWCGPGPAPKAIELLLPGGGTIVGHFSRPPFTCAQMKSRQPELDYGSFSPHWVPKSVIDAYGMKQPLPLRVSITKGLPTVRRHIGGAEYSFLKATRGTVLRFRVALRNTGTKPFRFARCPLFDEVFVQPYHPSLAGKPPPSNFYVLNCHSVGAIAPGKLAYFAMELPVPKNSALGQGWLIWDLVTFHLHEMIGARSAKANVWVVP